MLEITPAEAAVIVCAADQSVLDGSAGAPNRLQLRVAPDELWLIGPRDQRRALLAAGQALVHERGLAVDQTDGRRVITATGEDRYEVFRRLMVASVPAQRPALVQGAITGVPGKVICESARLHVLVPAGVGHHLMDRLAAVTGDLAVTTGPSAALILESGGASC